MTGRGDDDKPSEADRTGTTVGGRFHIEARLASGGYGVVWRATQQPLGRAVALKVLRADAADPHAAARLLREGQALAALRHENLVAIHDAGATEDGAPFVVMELVGGPSLRALLERGPLPWRDAAAVALGIARALDAAHGAGVIHRDLKPENVLLAADPGTAPLDARAVRVVDFGLAKRTGASGATDSNLSASAVLRGTPAYMSPEQADGKDADNRSDLYALGVMLYEQLTGANPFRAETPLKTLTRHTEGPRPPAPSHFTPSHLERCPAALDALALSLLHVDANARPASALDVVRALEAIDALRIPAPIPLSRPAVAVQAPSSLGRAIALSFTVLLAVGAAVVLGVLGGRATSPEGDGQPDAGTADVPTADVPPAHDDAAGPAVHTAPREDAGEAVLLDAGVSAARLKRTLTEADAGPAVTSGAATLPRKIKQLYGVCAARVPCARELTARYPVVMKDELGKLKEFTAEVDRCLATCALAEPATP